jgi:tryptophanyl-tRNA synthetase
MKKKLISGIKPTGRPHLGNYFGAMKQFVDLQDQYDSSIFIADYHALTTVRDPELLRSHILDVAIDYLAIGLDPKKVMLFQQSDVPVLAEAAWFFDCLVTMPQLMRAHAFKDAEAKNKEINVGVFNYPILMASDILLSNADVVPVGEDQRQHVEITRDIAGKFNRAYGETFKLPKEIVIDEVAVVPGTDGQKMSKSYGNTIPLFATDEEIQKAIMSIPTDSAGVEDSKNPDESIIYQIHSLLLNEEGRATLRSKFENGGVGYKDLKDSLIADLIDFIRPLRERRERIAKNPKKVLKILKKGGESANKRAQSIMEDVRIKTGISL